MNKNKELSRLLGIEPKSQCELSPVDECCELECPCIECELDKPNIYPDFTKPDNFVKLLEILTINNLEVVFGTCKYKNTNYYCDIYHYETMTDKNGIIDDLQELFCNIADNPQKAYPSLVPPVP